MKIDFNFNIYFVLFFYLAVEGIPKVYSLELREGHYFALFYWIVLFGIIKYIGEKRKDEI